MTWTVKGAEFWGRFNESQRIGFTLGDKDSGEPSITCYDNGREVGFCWQDRRTTCSTYGIADQDVAATARHWYRCSVPA